jgi:hypothetical protein
MDCYPCPMVLSCAVSCLSHGHITMDPGTCQLFNICPMSHYQSPMVLFPAVSHVSHRDITIDHGAFLHFNLYPMVQSPAVSHLSNGHLAMDHRTFYDYHLCPIGHNVHPMVLSVICPMVMFHLTSGPSDTSTSLHWPLCIHHSPVSCCVTSVPWTCSNGPCDFLTLHPLSHGYDAMDHWTF